MAQYILAHDFGTSGDKASLFTTEGEFAGSITVPYTTYYSNTTWAEQDPEDWWKAFCRGNKALAPKVDRDQILGVIFSGHYPGCLPMDKDGKPLYRSIIWQDMRAEKEAVELSEKTPELDFGWRANGIVNSVCTLPKLMWLRNNMRELFDKTHKVIICPNDYIIYKLTGKYVVEHGNADSSAAYDRYQETWSKEMLEAAGMSEDMFPEIHAITDIIGNVPENMVEECGLSTATKIITGSGDGPCATLGAGCIEPGDAYISGGSSAWIQAVFAAKEGEKGVTGGLVPGTVTYGSTMQAAGSSFSWMKNELCLSEQLRAKEEGMGEYDLINAAIENVPAGSNGVMFLPHMMGERAPRWNPKAKGSFTGLSLGNKREDLLRAVAEGIALNLNCILKEVREHGEVKRMVMIGGLSKGQAVRQVFADVMNAEIVMLDHMEELNSMGAVVFGGIALGIFKDYAAIRKFHKIIDVRKPNPEHRAVYDKLISLYDEVYYALEPLYPKMG